MATYECRICGITRNDSFISKIGTPKKCMQPNFKVKISSHSWKKMNRREVVNFCDLEIFLLNFHLNWKKWKSNLLPKINSCLLQPGLNKINNGNFLPRLPVEQWTTKEFLCTLAKFETFLTGQYEFRSFLLLEHFWSFTVASLTSFKNRMLWETSKSNGSSGLCGNNNKFDVFK